MRHHGIVAQLSFPALQKIFIVPGFSWTRPLSRDRVGLQSRQLRFCTFCSRQRMSQFFRAMFCIALRVRVYRRGISLSSIHSMLPFAICSLLRMWRGAESLARRIRRFETGHVSRSEVGRRQHGVSKREFRKAAAGSQSFMPTPLRIARGISRLLADEGHSQGVSCVISIHY